MHVHWFISSFLFLIGDITEKLSVTGAERFQALFYDNVLLEPKNEVS